MSTDQRAQATVNLEAIESNCQLLKGRIGDAELCAVVKADGYGHGAVPAAKAALSGGATWLAVVSAQEAADLREAGVTERVLVMGALTESETALALKASADLVAWTPQFADRVERLAVAVSERPRIHVKLDTGMGRLGEPEPTAALTLAVRLGESEQVDLVGAMTHFATADEPDDKFFEIQLDRFSEFAAEIKRRWPDAVIHAANSAATLREPRSHFDLVRCGIAVYGMDPFGKDPAEQGLMPALDLSSYVAQLKLCKAGESVGYGRRFISKNDTTIAVLPIGYGDGVRRALTNNFDVLIDGQRYPVVGTVSMDSITVDVGASTSIAVGDEAILIGTQGVESILAEEWAEKLDTVNYEVTCGISARVPRVYGNHE